MTSFEYKDEDGDRITVKSDEELHAMINFHLTIGTSFGIPSQQPGCGTNIVCPSLPKHLYLYPKVCKHPWKRNKHELKVAIFPTASSLLLAGQFSKKHSKIVPGLNGMNMTNTFSDNSSKQQFTLEDSVPLCYSSANTSNIAVPPVSEKHIDSNVSQSSRFSHLGKLDNDALVFLEVLGNGNSGVVRKAIHRQTKTITAVKTIALDLTGEEQQQILRELEILRRYYFVLSYKNLVIHIKIC